MLDTQKEWIEAIVIPAVKHSCSINICQRHSRSWEELENRAHVREERFQQCSGQAFPIKELIPQKFLRSFWNQIVRLANQRPFFREPFLILASHNLKHHMRCRKAADVKRLLRDHLNQLFDTNRIILPFDQVWVDFGVEDCPTGQDSPEVTLLWNRNILSSGNRASTNLPDLAVKAG